MFCDISLMAAASTNTTEHHTGPAVTTTLAITQAQAGSSTSEVSVIAILFVLSCYLCLRKMRKATVNSKIRPPVAPFGLRECIQKMVSDQQPWFPLEAKKALGNTTDTFVLSLPRRPTVTGDYALAREILMDPLSIKPRTYTEFEPLGVGTIFTRNGSFWVSNKQAMIAIPKEGRDEAQ